MVGGDSLQCPLGRANKTPVLDQTKGMRAGKAEAGSGHSLVLDEMTRLQDAILFEAAVLAGVVLAAVVVVLMLMTVMWGQR